MAGVERPGTASGPRVLRSRRPRGGARMCVWEVPTRVQAGHTRIKACPPSDAVRAWRAGCRRPRSAAAAALGMMTDGTTSLAHDLRSRGTVASSRRALAWRSALPRRWEVAVAVVAAVAAGAALWITPNARFLAHPGWLAVQKADFILGPVGVGLYWRHCRPENRFGLLLIALGLLGVPYILESSADPTLFGIGVLAETPIYVMTSLVILAFPTGRLDTTAERALMAFIVVVSALLIVVLNLAYPGYGPGFSISGCHAACPANGLAIFSRPSWLPQFGDFVAALLIAVPLATAGLVVWRFVAGTPPRRRSLAIGAPVALLFLLMQATYRALFLFAPNGLSPSERPVQSVLQWTFAGARSFLWYGFLFALIGAELYAGRVLRQLVDSSLGRPSFRELEGVLRRPLGDPGLRLGFWQEQTSEWVDADGHVLEPVLPAQTSTEVDRDGRPVVLIIHDQQLIDDPELLRAAGAVALLALENAELDAAWKDSLRALADSRTRLIRASDKERRKLERDLHDGAQQRLLAALIRLTWVDELTGELPELKRQITATRVELEAAIDELRDLARGIYPTLLAEVGLAGALRSVALRSPDRITVKATGQRFAPETEAAFYYCCLEAVQNALKHGGPEVQISVRLSTTARELRLEVRDTGPGFDPNVSPGGVGLQSMQDRLGAVGGHVEIRSQLGCGTVVTGGAPVGGPSHLVTDAR
jgi:signal transduction histidine kinase